LHITGCPNSCGQHWIADIESRAENKANEKWSTPTISALVEASPDRVPLPARVGYRCATTDVPDAIERLLNAFTDAGTALKRCAHFLARHNNEEFANDSRR